MRTAEKELRVPVLAIINSNPGISMSRVKKILSDSYPWTDEDREPSITRNEPKYKQVIGNLVSHNFVTKHCSVAGEGKERLYVINELGINYLMNNSTITNFSVDNIEISSELLEELNSRKPEIVSTASTTYKRNPIVRKKVLQDALGFCQIDNEHETFISRTGELPYLEVHHLIPMMYQASYEINLDMVDNMIAICPNCHRKLHYSVKDDEYEQLVKKLYTNHIEKLGIVSLSTFLSYYL